MSASSGIRVTSNAVRESMTLMANIGASPRDESSALGYNFRQVQKIRDIVLASVFLFSLAPHQVPALHNTATVVS